MPSDKLTTLVAEIRLDESPLRKSLAGLRSSIGGIVGKIGGEIGRQFSDAFNKSLKYGIAGAIAGAVASVKVASDAEEIRSKFATVFATMGDDAESFAQTLSRSVGRSVIDIRKSMADFGALFAPLGFAEKDALKLSEQVAGLAIDIASFSNATDAEAGQAIMSALLGESEPIKRFGVVLNETKVAAELMAMGVKGAATDVEKTTARWNIIWRATAQAQGDAARTSGSFANSWKALGGAVRDLAGDLGTVFIPAATQVVQALRESIGGLSQYRDQFADVGRAIGVVVSNFGTAWELAYTSVALWLTKAYDKTATVFDAMGKFALGGVEGIVAAVKSLAKDFVGVLSSMVDIARANAKLIAAEIASMVSGDKSGVKSAAKDAADARRRLGKSLSAPVNAADAMQTAWARRVSTIRDEESGAQKILQGDVDRLAGQLAKAWNDTGTIADSASKAPPATAPTPATLDVASMWAGLRDAVAGIWGSVSQMTLPATDAAAPSRASTASFVGLADYARNMQSSIGGSPEMKTAKATEKHTADALPILKIIADAGKATVDAILKPKPAVAT
jgi:hypothetical protein